MPAKDYKNRGFTILELMVSLFIITILTISAIPSWQKLVLRQQARTLANTFTMHLEHSRVYAMENNVPVSVCHSLDGRQCMGNWNDGLLSFSDHNLNGLPDGDDTVLFWTLPDAGEFDIQWRAFARRAVLTFPPRGRFLYNGSFTFCHRLYRDEYAKKLAINITGRLRQISDADIDCR